MACVIVTSYTTKMGVWNCLTAYASSGWVV